MVEQDSRREAAVSGYERALPVFRDLLTQPELFYQLLDSIPVPLEVFAPDGFLLFTNKAFLDFNGIADASALFGKYNLLADQVCAEIYGTDTIAAIFRGELVSVRNTPVPIQNLKDRELVDAAPFEVAAIDTLTWPIRDGERLVAICCLFIPKRVFSHRVEIDRALAYIEQHWLEPFDLGAVANAAAVSERHLNRLFREVVGCSPLEHYQVIKIAKIKEELLHPDSTITGAFSACGIPYNSAWLRRFREATGLSPTEFRKRR